MTRSIFLDTMTRSDFPDNWHDLIAGYTLGNLTPTEQAQLDQLLQEQPDLKEELRAYEVTLAQLPQALAAQSPPADLENRILQKLHGPEAVSPTRWYPEPRNRYRRYFWGFGTAIAAGLILFLGGNNFRLRRSLMASQQDLDAMKQVVRQLRENQQQTEAVLASLRTNEKAIYALEGTGELASASGSIVTLAEEDRAILIPHNLPTLPPEKIYRFWAAPRASNSLVYCGQFNTQQDDAVQWSLPAKACSAQAAQVVITIDPITASTESGGELVMQSPLSRG